MSQSAKLIPVNVVHIERASFADLHDIGLETLSQTDATVVHTLDMPGYEKFLQGVKEDFDGLPLEDAEAARLKLVAHPVMRRLEAEYNSLAVTSAGFRLGTETGASQEAQRSLADMRAPHFDHAFSEEVGSITLNATLFTQGDWFWGLSGDTKRSGPLETLNVAAATQVPLAEPGIVILGEAARSDVIGMPCTDVHEVISPESSWEADTVQRVRVAYYPRA